MNPHVGMRCYASQMDTAFQGRFRNISPHKQNILSGAATAGGGTATVGSEASALAHGFPLHPLNLLSGALNLWFGYDLLKRNGGVKGLKDPD